MKALAHQHHVGDTGAHVNGEKVLVQDTREDNVQQSSFDRDTLRGIALFKALPAVCRRSRFLTVSDDVWTSFDSLRKLLDNQTNVIESLLRAERNRREHCVLARFPEPFIRDLIDALTQDS